MKWKTCTPLLVFCFSAFHLFGQTLRDIRAEALDAEGRKIEIYYTLEDDVVVPTTYKVTLYAVIDNNRTQLYRVSGDIGDSVAVGSNRIVWDADLEYPRLRANVAFEIRVVSNFVIFKPERDVTMKRKNQYTFEWFGEGSTTDSLKLELYQYNTKVTDLDRVFGNFYYTWDIPGKIAPGDEYQLKITGTDQTKIVAFSNKFNIRRKVPLLAKVGVLTLGAAAIAAALLTDIFTGRDPLPEIPKGGGGPD